MDFRVFSSKIVHAELQRGGYQPPSLRTVARWTSTGKAPAWAEQAIRNLLAIEEEAPPPEWATGLVEDVPVIRADVQKVVDELTALRVALSASQSGLLPPDDDPVDDPLPEQTESRRDQ